MADHTAFALDTSGFVGPLPGARQTDGKHVLTHWWSDLDPFTQGYVEALFASLRLPTRTDVAPNAEGRMRVIVRQPSIGFRHLSPETLAAILKDCARRNELLVRLGSRGYGGGNFWRDRQAGHADGFPPLTPYLGDDGKVYLRETPAHG